MQRAETSMPAEELKLAIREAIQAEKDAMDFYRFAAERVFNEKARLTFKVLAGEEREHARAFYQAYTWGDLPPFDELIEAPPNTRSPWWQSLQQAAFGGLDEQHALSLALEQERSLEDRLRAMADKVGDPQIRAVYLANANMTQRHIEVISEDYQALRTVYH
jgi:rubrerythrin